MKFILRWAINTVALYVAIILLPHNIILQGTWVSIIWLALIFGLVNAILRPLLTVLSCPLIILTLGLGTLLINTLMFYLAGLIGSSFGVGFMVNGFLPAFLGALVVSIISVILSLVFREATRKN